MPHGGYPTQMCPGTPNPSLVPEGFMDTPVVNGTAYPVLPVARKAYRFRILNAANDRAFNLSLFYAADAAGNVCNGAITAGCTEVKMVPALPVGAWPVLWPTDNRVGGVPDPATAGPEMVQIGTEAGFLPAPAVIPPAPINYEYNRRNIVVLNISTHALLIGPAERADIIVDFSQVPDGARLILYNDAPAPVPAFDPRNDYYTGDPDQSLTGDTATGGGTGGAPTTLPGYGPNTRTIMQFVVSGAQDTSFSLSALQAAMASTNNTPGAFSASQPPPIVPEAAHGSAYNATFSDTYSTIQDTSLTFTPLGATATLTLPMQSKCIQELFELNYGRMNSTLGVELPFTNGDNQTTIPYDYIDPPTEFIQDSGTAGPPVPGDGTQLWKITHNGVDSHWVHFHLFNVQVINRVGWDGAIRPPDDNELGWKETVRMNPLEDIVVALRAIRPVVPFALPDSIRRLDVTKPVGATSGFFGVGPDGNPITITNDLVNFGWEYVWHCHILGHEENDMMRAMILAVPPVAPSALAATRPVAGRVALTWTDNSLNETQFTVQRATALIGPWTTLSPVPSTTGPTTGATVTYTDTTVTPGTTYYYRVIANNVVGYAQTFSAPAAGYPTLSADSAASGVSNSVTP